MSDTIAVLKPHPTLSALRGALAVMEAADVAGLPIPTHVTTSSYAAVRFGAETTVSFQPDSLDDLHTWAEYLGAPVTAHPNGDTVQHWCDCAVFDQRVSLCFIEDVTASTTSTYECDKCGAAFGIAGTGSGSEDDYAADDFFDDEVRRHESGECAR